MPNSPATSLLSAARESSSWRKKDANRSSTGFTAKQDVGFFNEMSQTEPAIDLTQYQENPRFFKSRNGDENKNNNDPSWRSTKPKKEYSKGSTTGKASFGQLKGWGPLKEELSSNLKTAKTSDLSRSTSFNFSSPKFYGPKIQDENFNAGSPISKNFYGKKTDSSRKGVLEDQKIENKINQFSGYSPQTRPVGREAVRVNDQVIRVDDEVDFPRGCVDNGNISLNDRTNHNLSHVSSELKHHVRISPHLAGFVNTGQTCYLNSTLQALVALPTFTSDVTRLLAVLLRTRTSQREINSAAVQHLQYNCPLSRSLIELVESLKERAGVDSGKLERRLRNIKYELGQTNPTFRGDKQQDVDEFLTILLDTLKEDTGTLLNLRAEANLLQEGDPLDEGGEDPLEDLVNPVADNFVYQERVITRCLSCNDATTTLKSDTFVKCHLAPDKPSTPLRSDAPLRSSTSSRAAPPYSPADSFISLSSSQSPSPQNRSRYKEGVLNGEIKPKIGGGSGFDLACSLLNLSPARTSPVPTNTFVSSPSRASRVHQEDEKANMNLQGDMNLQNELESLVADMGSTPAGITPIKQNNRENSRSEQFKINRENIDPHDWACELNLETLILANFENSELERRCEKCGGERAEVNTGIYSLPRILIVMLMRYGRGVQKISVPVYVPGSIDLRTVCVQDINPVDLTKIKVPEIGALNEAKLPDHLHGSPVTPARLADQGQLTSTPNFQTTPFTPTPNKLSQSGGSGTPVKFRNLSPDQLAALPLEDQIDYATYQSMKDQNHKDMTDLDPKDFKDLDPKDLKDLDHKDLKDLDNLTEEEQLERAIQESLPKDMTDLDPKDNLTEEEQLKRAIKESLLSSNPRKCHRDDTECGDSGDQKVPSVNAKVPSKSRKISTPMFRHRQSPERSPLSSRAQFSHVYQDRSNDEVYSKPNVARMKLFGEDKDIPLSHSTDNKERLCLPKSKRSLEEVMAQVDKARGEKLKKKENERREEEKAKMKKRKAEQGESRWLKKKKVREEEVVNLDVDGKDEGDLKRALQLSEAESKQAYKEEEEELRLAMEQSLLESKKPANLGAHQIDGNFEFGFSSEDEGLQEPDVVVQEPVEVVEESRLVGEEVPGTCQYELVSIINHTGGQTVNSGHYTAQVYRPETKSWHKYDDSSVTSIPDPSNRTTTSGYIFMYVNKAVSEL